jgi:hypothetical protein
MTNPNEPAMKTRVHDWIDLDTNDPRFGVQVRIDTGKWAHTCQGGKPLLFDTWEEARSAAKSLQAELNKEPPR